MRVERLSMSTRNVARRRARIVDGTTASAMSSIRPTVTVTAATTGATPTRSGTTSTAIECCPAANASGISSSSSTSAEPPAGIGPVGAGCTTKAGSKPTTSRR